MRRTTLTLESRRRLLGLTVLVALSAAAQDTPVQLTPSTMPKLGAVDPRYLSWNVEMVEVTGGRFWKPYNSPGPSPNTPPDPHQPVGGNSGLYQYRPPIDLGNPRLRKLAQALAPSYMRVSGTWANSTYFQNDDQPALPQPPKGFNSVLTRPEWKAVIGFSRVAGAQLVTSVAISAGTRNADGIWTPAQAKALFDYTESLGGAIAATEFMNEPTFAAMGGAPPDYDPADFARDAKLFAAFLRHQSPHTLFLGPGGVGEGIPLAPPGAKLNLLASRDLLIATGPLFDAFSYHSYGAVSRRCGGTARIDQALSSDWLVRTDTIEAFYAALRDQYLPGKPMWLTETAEAACGGDPFAGQFADTFRFLNQLGALAQKGVQVVMRNTLASSDYGLLNENTLDPKPDFWAALLWKRLMGPVVLDPGPSRGSPLRIYAQCAKDKKGGVTLLLLNTDTTRSHTVTIALPAKQYTLTADSLASTRVSLSGTELRAQSDGSLPAIEGQPASAGTLPLPPESITFLTVASARNPDCRN